MKGSMLLLLFLLSTTFVIGCDEPKSESNGEQPPATRDGMDNDNDGTIDEPDEAATDPAKDGVDNDNDGTIDEPDEAGAGAAKDGIDNDADGTIDEPDEAAN